MGYKFGEASLRRLYTCDVRLQEIAYEAIKIVDFVVLEGHRNQEDQDRAYMMGKSQLKWPKGKHNSFPSKAMDIAPYYPDIPGKLSWKDVVAFGRLMGIIQAIAHTKGYKVRFGLDWDGDFKTAGFDPDEKFFDAPHVEIVD